MNVMLFIVIGMLSGWLSGRIMKGRGFGFIGNLVVGTIGALLGGFIFSKLNIIASGIFGSLITSVFGAVVMLFIFGRFRNSRKTG